MEPTVSTSTARKHIMPATLKVRRLGNSLGTIIPKEVADALHVQEGDELYVTETPEGIMLTPYDPEFADAMEDAQSFMDSHRNAFRELAD